MEASHGGSIRVTYVPTAVWLGFDEMPESDLPEETMAAYPDHEYLDDIGSPIGPLSQLVETLLLTPEFTDYYSRIATPEHRSFEMQLPFAKPTTKSGGLVPIYLRKLQPHVLRPVAWIRIVGEWELTPLSEDVSTQDKGTRVLWHKWLAPPREPTPGRTIKVSTGVKGSDRQFQARFGVGSPSGPRSSVWKVWTHLSRSHGFPSEEVYVAYRSVGHLFKVSLHQSGRWHVARTGPAEPNTEQSRFLYKWSRPIPYDSVTTAAFRICVPESELRCWHNEKELRGDVHWISPPAEDMFTDIRIMITPTEDPSAQRGADAPGESWRLVAQRELQSGEFLWIVHRERPVTDNQRQVLGRGRQAMQKVDRARHSPNPPEELRGFLQVVDDTGAVGFIEVALSDSPS